MKRILKAWDYGVEAEDMDDRFGLSRSELYRLLKKHGRNTTPVAMSRQTMRPGTKPRTGKWSMA